MRWDLGPPAASPDPTPTDGLDALDALDALAEVDALLDHLRSCHVSPSRLAA
jgi:hypothetical protein